jgi:hypothetical protein
MTNLLLGLYVTAQLTTDRITHRIHAATGDDPTTPGLRDHRERGLGTLEMVIITLGLMAVAALLVAAITTAVTSRTNQIK